MQHDPRELEWQRRYVANDTPWDKGAAAPPLLDFLAQGVISGRVLVPGCGRGHDARAIAAQAPTDVVGLDLSPEAITQARAQTPPFIGNMKFVSENFFELAPTLTGSFDWIVEHTCFCALDPIQRPKYVAACAEALRPNGRIFAIFYLDPRSETAPPFPVGRQELDGLFGARFGTREEWVPTSSFPGREDRELVRVLQRI